MGIWKNVASQVGGLAKHVAKTVAAEPIEVIKDAVGEKIEQATPSATQTGGQGAQPSDPMNDLAKAGFKTEEDFKKYEGLSEKKDDLELAQIRGKLVREWGLDTNLESEMQRARLEYEQKEKQRKEVKEKEKEQKKEFEFQKKQQDNAQVAAAQRETNPENKSWGAG